MDVLQTERLILEPIHRGDLEDLYALNSEPATMRFLGGVRTRDQTSAEIERILAVGDAAGFGAWMVRRRSDRLFLGRCGIKPAEGTSEHELLYAFREAFHGLGYATESAFALLDRTFECGVRRIIAVASPANTPSIAVMARIGMAFDRRAHMYGEEVLVYAVGYRAAISAVVPSAS